MTQRERIRIRPPKLPEEERLRNMLRGERESVYALHQRLSETDEAPYDPREVQDPGSLELLRALFR